MPFSLHGRIDRRRETQSGRIFSETGLGSRPSVGGELRQPSCPLSARPPCRNRRPERGFSGIAGLRPCLALHGGAGAARNSASALSRLYLAPSRNELFDNISPGRDAKCTARARRSLSSWRRFSG